MRFFRILASVMCGVLLVGCAQSKEECFDNKLAEATRAFVANPTGAQAPDVEAIASQCGMSSSEMLAHLAKQSTGQPASPSLLPSDRVCRLLYSDGEYVVYRGQESLDRYTSMTYGAERIAAFVAADICEEEVPKPVCDVNVTTGTVLSGRFLLSGSFSSLSYAVEARDRAISLGLCVLKIPETSKCWVDTDDGANSFKVLRDGEEFSRYSLLSYATERLDWAVQNKLCVRR